MLRFRSVRAFHQRSIVLYAGQQPPQRFPSEIVSPASPPPTPSPAPPPPSRTLVVEPTHRPTSTTMQPTTAPLPQIHALPTQPITAETTLESLQWVPPPPLVQRSMATIQQQAQLQEIESYRQLPPMPVGGGFNSYCPEEVKAERAFMDAVEKTLPPRDLFRVPIMLSRPWFGHVLKAYCFFVGVCIVLFGNWDALSEGHPHVFSGIQNWYRDKRDRWRSLDEKEETIMLQERLREAAILPSK